MAKDSKRWLGSKRAWSGARRLLARAGGAPAVVLVRGATRGFDLLTLDAAGERLRVARPPRRRTRKPD